MKRGSTATVLMYLQLEKLRTPGGVGTRARPCASPPHDTFTRSALCGVVLEESVVFQPLQPVREPVGGRIP